MVGKTNGHSVGDEKAPDMEAHSLTEETFQFNDEIRPKDAHVKSMEKYHAMHRESIHEPEKFWSKIADEFYWQQKWSGKFMDYNFDLSKGDIFVKFMEGGKTNICYNVLDRTVKDKQLGHKIAFYWYVYFS